MFAYSPELARYVEQRRDIVRRENKEMGERLRVLVPKFCRCNIARNMTLRVLDRVETSANEIYEKPDSTVSFIANLRFLFETCINVRLLNAEAAYKYKLTYSIYRHQLEKSQGLKNHLEVDRRRLRKLSEDEESLKPTSLADEDVKAWIHSKDALYEELEKEVTGFLDLAEFYGANYLDELLEKYLVQHNEREQGISEEWERTKKNLISDESLNGIFNFDDQICKVESQLKDHRNWKDKARIVGLEEMYKFVYDYTSAILHSTSYSLLLPNQLDDAEKSFIIGLAGRFSHDCLINLCKFSEIPNFKVVCVDA